MNISPLLILCAVLSAYAALSVLYYLIRLRPRLRQDAPGTEGGSAGVSPCQDNPPAGLPLLQRALDEWRYTFDAIIDPVLILDNELRIIKANRAAQQLLSTNGTPIEGSLCHQVFAGTDTPCPFCPMATVRLENGPHRQEIFQRYLGRTFSASCSPLYEDGQIAGFVYSAKDISLQRTLEKRLVHAHKMESIATLAGGIAHDFNNILGVILGNADLLLYRLPQKEGQKKALGGAPITMDEITEHTQAIRRAGSRAKELIAQILAFSRQSTNTRQELLIAPVVKESCRLLRSTLPATIEIKVSVPEGIGMIYADASQIQQVLMHLCTNAAQSLVNNTGTMEVSLREIVSGAAEQLRYNDLAPGRYVVLTVKDTGKGMAPEVLERIFDPFFTTREVGQGSGMGLAVLHGIIVAHNGVIDVRSEPEKGTVFTVFFPRVPDAATEEEDPDKALPRGRETIVFVDDEEDIVGMRTRMLAHLGYRVLGATTPEQALDILAREESVDLLITDHTMPRMTGLQLAARVSVDHPGLPIILCSGYSEAVTVEEARRAGVRRFLAKPVDMRQLAVAIREMLTSQGEALP